MRSDTRLGGALGLLGFLAASFGAAGLGGFFTAESVRTWYKTIRKPSWNPPSWLFGPVWTVLYAMMAISAWLVQREARGNPALARSGALALGAWVHQLVLNVTWSWVFFGRRQIGPGFGVLKPLVRDRRDDLALLAGVEEGGAAIGALPGVDDVRRASSTSGSGDSTGTRSPRFARNDVAVAVRHSS